MATGIYRDPALERLQNAQRAATTGGGRGSGQYLNVGRPAPVVVQPGFVGPLTPGTVVAQGPRFGETMSQAQLAQSAMRDAKGVAGGGFWEGGDIFIDPVTRETRPTASALANLRAERDQDPWANIDWEGLGRLMDTQDPGWRDRDSGTGEGTTGGETPTPAPAPAPAPAPDTTVSDLLAALAEATGFAREQITSAGTTLREQLEGRDPMATYTWNRPTVSIPTATLANYVQATGGSPAEVQATQQLSQQLLDSFLGDVGQFAQATGAADETMRGRTQDVGANLTADALRQLALNEQAQKIAIQRSEADRARALQDQALSLLLQFATAKPSGSSLDVTVPQLPFNTVNIPGVGPVYVPNTLTGGTV